MSRQTSCPLVLPRARKGSLGERCPRCTQARVAAAAAAGSRAPVAARSHEDQENQGPVRGERTRVRGEHTWHRRTCDPAAVYPQSGDPMAAGPGALRFAGTALPSTPVARLMLTTKNNRPAGKNRSSAHVCTLSVKEDASVALEIAQGRRRISQNGNSGNT